LISGFFAFSFVTELGLWRFHGNAHCHRPSSSQQDGLAIICHSQATYGGNLTHGHATSILCYLLLQVILAWL